MFLLPLLLAAFAAVSASLQPRTLSEQDNGVLELAQYFEHILVALFDNGCSNFTDTDFSNAGIPGTLRDSLCTMAAQDNTHAITIGLAAQNNKGLVVPPCTYQGLDFADPKEFVYFGIEATSAIIGYYLAALEVCILVDDPCSTVD